MSTESNREFRILAIDGGGIKGLYSSTILEHFEDRFNCLVSDHFDLLCGTSTGGLIALAASLKIPMADVSQFYLKEGPKIFPDQRNIWLLRLFGKRVSFRTISQIIGTGKFSEEPRKEAFENIFGGRKLKESNNYLCIPSYSVTDARPWIFKKDHHKLDRDDETRYVDVALATSAAPTFFPLAEITDYNRRQFIDGGVWANNPSMVGLIEALDYFVGAGKEFDSVRILSISSLSIKGGMPLGLRRKRSFIHWGNDLFETAMTGQSMFCDYFLSRIKNLTEVKVDYVRIPTAAIAREQEKHIQLDVATENALHLIRAKGNDMGYEYKKLPEIELFFQQQKLSKVQ